MGVAEGSVEEGVGVVKSLRLSVHEESDNWAILSEVSHCLFCLSTYLEKSLALINNLKRFYCCVHTRFVICNPG